MRKEDEFADDLRCLGKLSLLSNPSLDNTHRRYLSGSTANSTWTLVHCKSINSAGQRIYWTRIDGYRH